MFEDAQKNLVWYRLYTAFSFTPFMLPVIVLFWQDNGLNLMDVFLLQAIFGVAMVVLEVPTGIIADRMGKRTSILWGVSLTGIGIFIYSLGYSFAAFLVAEIVLALSACLVSGADSALLYDSLKALDREDEYQTLEGKARSTQMIVFGLCNLAGGIIGSYSLRATMWATLLGPLIALPIALRLKEIQAPAVEESFRDAWRAYRSHTAQSLRFVSKHGLVRWQILFMGVIIGSSTWLLWLYQPYMEFTGLPVWAFGAAFASFNLVAAFASGRAGQLEQKCGQKGTLVVIAALQVIPLLLMSTLRMHFSFMLIWGQQITRGVLRPIMDARILRHTYADKRSTVLSMGGLAGRLFFSVTAPMIGWISESSSMPSTLLSQGGVLVLIFILLGVWYTKIPQKHFQVKEKVLERQ